MRIWRAVQGEGSELCKTPEPGALPLSVERGPSSVFDPASKWPPPPKKIRTGQRPDTSVYDPPKKQGLMLEGCWTSLVYVLLWWYLEREVGFCGSLHCWKREIKAPCGSGYCCGSRGNTGKGSAEAGNSAASEIEWGFWGRMLCCGIWKRKWLLRKQTLLRHLK